MREPFYVDPGAAGNYVIRDGYLFTVNENENSVVRTRLTDREQKSVPFTGKESYSIQIMRSLFDGNLMVTENRLDDANDTKDAYTSILDFDAGTCMEFTLQVPSGRGPVYAAAAVGDLYYVSTDLTYYSIPVVMDDFVTWHEYAASEYAFISRQEYYASDPNGYRTVKDAFKAEKVQKALQDALDASS